VTTPEHQHPASPPATPAPSPPSAPGVDATRAMPAGPPTATDGTGRRGRLMAIGAGLAVVLLVVLVVWAVQAGDSDAGDLDRADPQAVATAFVQRYATHDPSVCELAEPRLRDQLDRQGRCTGQSRGDVPVLQVRMSVTCGEHHGFGAQVEPPGEVGAPHVSVGLTRFGTQWLVDQLRPVQDGSVLRPYACDTG